MPWCVSGCRPEATSPVDAEIVALQWLSRARRRGHRHDSQRQIHQGMRLRPLQHPHRFQAAGLTRVVDVPRRRLRTGDTAEHRQPDPAGGQHRLPSCISSSRSASASIANPCAAPVSTTTSSPPFTCTRISPPRARRFPGAGLRSKPAAHGVTSTRGSRRAMRCCLDPSGVACRPKCWRTIAPENVLSLPMLAGNRSLNLANAAAIAVYEAWRQTGFAGARRR